ncbi:MAG: Pullulanase [Chroococcopsis gigantea SAG 12.99]|jgi:1,4-alpha-glucan branching enzyme|nr:Pullulanase [Chroococcopsis gigantea SAG 12.99]
MSIEINLFAPYNQEVKLTGSWDEHQEIPMEKTEDGYFKTSIDLEDGVYLYKFRLKSNSPDFRDKEWVDVIDPYATDVDDVNKHAVLKVKEGKKIVDSYVWRNDDHPLPGNHELVIYEMHLADFTGGEDDEHKRGTYKDAIAKLDHLVELGINAIELMPVNEYPGDYSWGYTVRHFFATESSYGSTADLKQFIDECHGRGIRIIMDGIYNHTDTECPLLMIDRNYWYYEHMHYPEDPDNYWGPEFKYDKYDEKLDVKPAWKYIGDVVRFWVQEYHIDGIRYDAVRQLNNFEFLDWLAQQAKKNAAPKPFYNIAEHIPDSSSVTAPEGPLDACWHESFRYFLMPALCGKECDLEQLKNVFDPRRQGYASGVNVINYISTHDRERLFRELGNCNIFDEEAFKRARFAGILLMTAMGIPMLWMGEEIGEHKRKSEKVTQAKKVAWPLLENEENRDLLEYYKKVIRLRKESQALQSDNIEFFHENHENKVLGYVRWTDEGEEIAILANFSDHDLHNYEANYFPDGKTWRDWETGKLLHGEDNKLTIDLPSYTAKILIKSEG